MSPLSTVQPYFAAFCVAHGAASFAEMKARDGGLMGMNFMLWIRRQWRDWAAAVGRKLPEFKSPQDHAEFEAWLGSKFPA